MGAQPSKTRRHTVLPALSRPTMRTWNSCRRKKSFQKPKMRENCAVGREGETVRAGRRVSRRRSPSRNEAGVTSAAASAPGRPVVPPPLGFFSLPHPPPPFFFYSPFDLPGEDQRAFHCFVTPLESSEERNKGHRARRARAERALAAALHPSAAGRDQLGRRRELVRCPATSSESATTGWARTSV